MGLKVCPIAVVAAPVEVVWANLVQWERYFDWADVQAERVEPEGPATPGQTITFGGKVLGRTLRFTFKVEAVNPEKHHSAASHMAETSSSHQAGGVGFSKHLARKQSPPASKSPCSASRARLKDSIRQCRPKGNRCQALSGEGEFEGAA